MRKTKALTQLLRKGLFILCILSAAFLSVWCITKNLQPVAQKYGAKWLLHIAGISIVPQTQLKAYPELSAPKTPVVSETGIEPDGVLETEPEVELRVEATPDPNRETGIVEVLKMSSGQRVDCFSVKDETGTGLDLEQELLIKPDISVVCGSINRAAARIAAPKARQSIFPAFDFCKTAYTSMETASICRTPNLMKKLWVWNIISMPKVTAESASATPSSIRPRRRFEREREQDIPQEKINPATTA